MYLFLELQFVINCRFLEKERKINFYWDNCSTLPTLSEIQTMKGRIAIDNVFALFPENFSLSVNENVIFTIRKGERSLPFIYVQHRHKSLFLQVSTALPFTHQ